MIRLRTLVFAFLATVSGAAWAAPSVQIMAGLASGPQPVVPVLFDVGNGAFVSGGNVNVEGQFNLDWQILVKPDPFAAADITFTNLTDVPQTYFFALDLGIAPPVTPASSIGYGLSMTLTDEDFSSFARATDAGVPILVGFTDAVPVAIAFPPLYSLETNDQGGVVSDATGIPITLGLPVFTNIGILNIVTLSAGDKVRLTSILSVEAIPEAGSMSLLGTVMAAGGFSWFLRRRRKVA